MSETFEKISKVLDGDGVVHAAGGKPVVHRYQVVKMLSEDGNKIEYKPHGPWVVMADVHEIHVSRLQAENAALQQRLNVADQAIDELKSVAPVPPAGDVEVVAEIGDLGFARPWVRPRIDNPSLLPPMGTELVDRAHVTRLTAELAQVRHLMTDAYNSGVAEAKENDALRAKLTKARELLVEVKTDYVHGPNVGHKWFERRDAFLAHQSAPAAKCETCDGTGHDLDGGMNPNGDAADCLDCGGRGTAAKGEGDE